MALSESASHLNGKMKVLSFGAGAIGTYIGGSLALAGHQLVFGIESGGRAARRRNGSTLDNAEQRSLRLMRLSLFTAGGCASYGP
jgi:ketopantoate reductase